MGDAGSSWHTRKCVQGITPCLSPGTPVVVVQTLLACVQCIRSPHLHSICIQAVLHWPQCCCVGMCGRSCNSSLELLVSIRPMRMFVLVHMLFTCKQGKGRRTGRETGVITCNAVCSMCGAWKWLCFDPFQVGYVPRINSGSAQADKARSVAQHL